MTAPRLIATALTLAAVAAAPTTAFAGNANGDGGYQARPGSQCGGWMCGTNHNEVLAG